MESKKPFVKKSTVVLMGILAAGLLGAFIFVPKEKPVKIPDPITPVKCGIQECHGLDLTCGPNIPRACTEIYAMGDRCRTYASCKIIDGECKLTATENFAVCKSCVQKCEAAYQEDSTGVFDCESKCTETNETIVNDQPAIYTLDQVKTHANEESCWSVVRGNVYDLTSAINTHKSGPEDILNMCGKDATNAYVKKHGGQSKAESWLETLKIGTLQ